MCAATHSQSMHAPVTYSYATYMFAFFLFLHKFLLDIFVGLFAPHKIQCAIERKSDRLFPLPELK